MSAFNTNPWDIEVLLKLMDSGKIALPEFQRSFVWRPADIDLLLTSLVQDYPAGSLLFLKHDGKNELASRAAELVPTSHAAGAPDYLVLDGQQRLTSLSIALNGRGDHVFLMDLALVEDGDLERGIYPLRRNTAEKLGLFERKTQFAKNVFPLWAAVGEKADDWWFIEYADYHAKNGGGDQDDLRERAKRLKAQFVDPLAKYRFPVVELPADTGLEAVCQIFETLNKTGMKLTVFDLLTAKFWPQKVELREMYGQAQGEYPLLGPDEFDIEPVILLQAVSLLRSGQCRRGDLLALDVANFEQDWDRVCEAASTALGILRSECGVLTRDWVPYATLLPALFALSTRVMELKGPAVGDAWSKITRWFWCACFSQRYEGPINTLNATDLRELRDWLDHDDHVPAAVSEFSLADVRLGSIERQRNAIYRAVICLTIVNGARDFHSGQRLTADVLRDPTRRVEDHHIFPSGYLKKRGEKADNSILNRCLIDHQTNRTITDKAPSVYLRAIASQLSDDHLDDVLVSHLIPVDGPGAPAADDHGQFVRAREQLLRRAIAGVTGAPLHEEWPETAYLDPATPFTNELALRKVIRGLHGSVFWYEQHMSRKNLEPLIEELDCDRVQEIRLLSGPANISDKVKRAFESFAVELRGKGATAHWRVLPAEVARDMHARVIFDDSSAWELPPLNSLYKGTVDSIHRSQIPRDRFEDAWNEGESLATAPYIPLPATPEAQSVTPDTPAAATPESEPGPADALPSTSEPTGSGVDLGEPADDSSGGGVTWEEYERRLPAEHFAVLRGVFERIERWVSEHRLPYQPVLRHNYYAFHRAGGYSVTGMDVRSDMPCRFWVKLPDDPGTVGLSDPYPDLGGYWVGRYRQWTWEIPAVAQIPDVGPALEVAVPLQPAAGHMPKS
jgi:hypothetical protein